ncbi:unnamed protein product [Zymoseptoria tritici ST99CH_3D1]|nr:unnamed protein product [Zymoseptoria tritici ST99CH_3D1]
MAYLGPGSGSSSAGLGYGESGGRRKRLAGYLKAAKEMGQNYLGGEGERDNHDMVEDGPGAFPDAAVIRSGNEEMILFPSYARRHVKSKQTPATPGQEITEEEYWRREWSKQEDLNAVVDVDVRGWIYTPHRGQNTRKQRLVIGLARQLSGLPSSAAPSRNSSPSKESRVTQQEQELIALEADNIVRKGQQEERYADRGQFSENPGRFLDADSTSLSDSLDRGRQRSSYASTISSQDSDLGSITPVQSRNSWQQPGKMTSSELAVANMHLINRLKPFMANPLANTPISAFFYNESASRQQTVYTDSSGHFSVRAALDFVPTHVRVLAGEKLSATEEVIVTAPHGVSLISDIDDTIKHSAISSGAREIFRNAFVRELGDLTIEGVREWYTTLHEMGVKLHYVSNSPWQMYPVLTSYFKLANLPQGSFHLKQYSGMLQGIFEPVAERKKSSLDKLMRDFPDRKFILVGDSGEADLEIYTETALEWPGQVIGIFIRDVTTSVRTGFFDPSSSPGGANNHNRDSSWNQGGNALSRSKRLSRPNDIKDDDADLKSAIAASLHDLEEETRKARRSINPDALAPESFHRRQGSGSSRPALPSRPSQSSVAPEEDLIDFSEPSTDVSSSHAHVQTSTQTKERTQTKEEPRSALSPPPPPKPSALRSPPSSSSIRSQHTDGSMKPPPPIPRKPSSAVKTPTMQTHHPSPLSQVTRQESTRKIPPPLPDRPPRTYRELAKDTIAKARPMVGSYWQQDGAPSQPRPRSVYHNRGNSQPGSPLARPTTWGKSMEDLSIPDAYLGASKVPPPPPSRRNLSSMPRQQAANRMSGSGWDDSDSAASTPGEGVSKKEFLWKQRWDRARNVLERNGITARTWRTGQDVADVCVKLVELELRRIEKEQKRSG